MQICQLEQYGVPVWSASPLTQNLLATGTWTGSTNEPQSLLRISNYDINKGINLLGMTLSPTKFAGLDWTDFNNEYGIIAGGMGDGAITLWDTRKIIDSYASGGQGNNTSDLKMGRGCISAANIHNNVPVTSIEFNPHKKNLLASGGAEVLIQDISHNIKQPNVFKPGVPNYHQGSRITSISWNRVVSHILASASENGKIVVWDLKVNKSIFTFTEPSASIQQTMSGAGGADDYFDYFSSGSGSGSGMDQQNAAQKRQAAQQQVARETFMVWNPEIPTQFLVANDDDQNPSLNIWDLRNPDYPVATYQDIHYNGILSASWSFADPSLLVSSAKDYRTLVINARSGERILEFPTQSQFKKIAWSTPLKGKITAMDSEGNTQVLSLHPEGLYTNPNRPFAVPQPSTSTNTLYAPKYLHPRYGARFGFGNKLVSFGSSNGPLIRVHHKPVQPDLAAKIQELDQALESVEITQLIDQKIQEAPHELDKIELTVMKCLYRGKFDDLFKMFGFDQTKIVQEVEKYLGKKLLKPPQTKQEQLAAQQIQAPVPQKQEFERMTAESAADFFSELGNRSQAGAPNQSNQQTANNNNSEESKVMEQAEDSATLRERKMSFITETVSKNTNWDESVEGIIKRNLLIGNLEYAAEVALKAGRTTEALLIAECGGEQLFEKIKEDYFQSSKDSYIKLFLRSIVQEDFKELVSTQALHHKSANWRENLAYLISYLEGGEEMKNLVHELAEELLKKKDINSAIICYMVSQSLETVVDLWKKRCLFLIKKGMDRNEALFQLFEKCILFKTVCKSTKVMVDLDLIVADMADYMASEDLKMLAMKYLELCNPRQANVAFIKEKIYNSDSTKVIVKHFAKPPVPYQVEKVKVQMSIYARQQQQQQQLGKQGGAGVANRQMGGVTGIQQKQQQDMFGQQHMTGGGQHQQHQHHQQQFQQQQQQQQQFQQQQQQQMRQRGPPLNTEPHLVHNFGYNEQNKVPLGRLQTPPNQQQQQQVQAQFGGGIRQPAPIHGQQQQQQQFRGPPPEKLMHQHPMEQNRPRVINPAEMAKQQEQDRQNLGPMPMPGVAKQQQQSQPRQQIRPPPIRQGGPGGIQHPPLTNADQGRPPSSHQQPPPPIGGPRGMPPPPVLTQMNQPTPRNDLIQPPPPVMQQELPQQIGGAPVGQVRPRGPPPGGFRPPFMGGNQQTGTMPPPGQQPPPMNMSGPRPMGGMRPPSQTQSPATTTQQHSMMAGSGGSADASSQEVNVSLSNLFNVYTQVEMNQKVRQETESKYSMLRDRLAEGTVSPQVVSMLKGIIAAVEQNNFGGALNIHKELVQKNWQESKDWSNALKVLITFKQRFTQ